LALYNQALRHRSAIGEDQPELADNERLEFLGDAVLDSVVGELVYRQYPDQGEGFLTRMRSKLVSRHQLSILAQKVEIERVMQVNIGPGRDTSVPGNAIEALFGALFLDKGFERTRRVVVKLINTHFDLKAVEMEDRDSKSRLLEWGQKQHRKVEFVLAEENERGGRGKLFTAEVQVDGKPSGTGKGHSKKKAEQEAARDAYRRLGLRHGPREDAPAESRQRGRVPARRRGAADLRRGNADRPSGRREQRGSAD